MPFCLTAGILSPRMVLPQRVNELQASCQKRTQKENDSRRVRNRSIVLSKSQFLALTRTFSGKRPRKCADNLLLRFLETFLGVTTQMTKQGSALHHQQNIVPGHPIELEASFSEVWSLGQAEFVLRPDPQATQQERR